MTNTTQQLLNHLGQAYMAKLWEAVPGVVGSNEPYILTITKSMEGTAFLLPQADKMRVPHIGKDENAIGGMIRLLIPYHHAVTMANDHVKFMAYISVILNYGKAELLKKGIIHTDSSVFLELPGSPGQYFLTPEATAAFELRIYVKNKE